MLLLFAEIESRGTGANTGALIGGVALLLVWILVVAVQILRHRSRRAVLAQERQAGSGKPPVPPAEHGADGP